MVNFALSIVEVYVDRLEKLFAPTLSAHLFGFCYRKLEVMHAPAPYFSGI